MASRTGGPRLDSRAILTLFVGSMAILNVTTSLLNAQHLIAPTLYLGLASRPSQSETNWSQSSTISWSRTSMALICALVGCCSVTASAERFCCTLLQPVLICTTPMLVGAVGFRWAATRYRYSRPHLLTLAGLASMLLIASHFFNAGATSFHTMLVAALLELPAILHNIPWPLLDCLECCVPARRMLASAGICILLAAASIYRRLQLNPSQSSPATNPCGCSSFNFILPGASLPNQSEWQEFQHPLSARPQWRHVRTRACTDKRPKEYRWCPDGVCWCSQCPACCSTLADFKACTLPKMPSGCPVWRAFLDRQTGSITYWKYSSSGDLLSIQSHTPTDGVVIVPQANQSSTMLSNTCLPEYSALLFTGW